MRSYGIRKQATWKEGNGLSQVDEEGESYMTHYSDYRNSHRGQDFNSNRGHAFYQSGPLNNNNNFNDQKYEGLEMQAINSPPNTMYGQS